MPNSTPVHLPGLQEFCVSIPLYAPFKLESDHTHSVYELIVRSATIDCFCVDCNRHSVFHTQENKIVSDRQFFQISPLAFTREFFCTRVPAHRTFFHFRIRNERLEKIGQSPSLADLSEVELRKYKKVLDSSAFSELSKAVGLASHGVGIGSFVYLRRIFEGLITEAANVARKHPDWDEDSFGKSRMEEKILLLKSHLPDFLVAQRKIYGILSMGIHSLSEELCLEAFPVVRLGIEMMLEAKLAANVQMEKMKDATTRLQQIQKKIKPS